MRHFADSVDQWVGATSGRYFSLLYNDEESDIYLALKENEWVSAILGGIEGVAGGLCKAGVMDIAGTGGSFSPEGGAGYAFITAQRSSFVNVTNPSETLHEYVISFTVDPAKCDLQFTPTIANTQTGVKLPILFNVPFLQMGDESFTFRAVIPSKKIYDKICLEFTGIPLDCLEGVNEATPICNAIPSGEEIVTQEEVEDLQKMFERQLTEAASGFGIPFTPTQPTDAVPATSGPVVINDNI